MHDDYAEIKIVGGKYDGTTSLIDLEDIEKCKKYKWYAQLFGYKRKRLYFTNPKNNLLLHRYIVNNYTPIETDHIDNDGLNNRKYNLRVCGRQRNAQNRKFNSNNTSGHKGVCWNKHIPTPKWMAYIQVNKKFVNLGYFDEYEDAVIAREKAEAKYYGEYSNTNI